MSSLENGLRILSLLGADRPVLRVNEVSAELGLPKSSISRLMTSLGGFGFLEREPGGGYRVGVAGLVLHECYFATRSLSRDLDRTLAELVTSFPFTALAATLSGSHVVLVNTRQGNHPLRVVQAIGTWLPAEETTTGMCLLARLDDEAAADRIRSAGREVGPEFFAALDAIRRNGFHREASRRTKGVGTIGSAVVSADGEGLAFCLTYPITEGEDRENEMIVRVVQTASDLGRRFGDIYWVNR